MPMVYRRGYFLGNLVALGLLLTFLSGCGEKGSSAAPAGGSAAEAKALTEADLGDTSVPPELGGPGFTGEGWQTAPPTPVGDPSAIKGGRIQSFIRDWPENMRIMGRGSNTHFNGILESLCYQSLLAVDPNTLDYQAQLATHWQISEDKMTFRFRINPKARWSDGKPVVADDVLATFEKHMDDTMLSPMSVLVYSKYKAPKAISKYIVEVTAEDQNWRNFLYFAGMSIQPAHVLRTVTGKEYLDTFHTNLPPGSGPYTLNPDDIKKGQSLTLVRRPDFWAKDEPQNVGLYNFDKIRFVIIQDEQLAYEKVIKGQLDFFNVIRAEWWVKEIPNLAVVKKGWLVRQKVFTDDAIGVAGMAINTRKAPLNDRDVRLALQHLFNRKELIAKLAHGEYKPLSSYYQGGEYQNPENVEVEYSPREAVRLLAEAGWKERGPDGVLTKDGRRLSIELQYSNKILEKYLTSFQQDCKEAGVDIRLKETNMEALWPLLIEHKFEMVYMGWSGLTFPNPETSFSGSLADATNNNNITGFKSARVDELLKQYDLAFTQEERRNIIREIDGILFKEQHYVLSWYSPYQRLLYWNKFGMPKSVLLRTVDTEASVFATWWYDPEKAKQLEKARQDGTPLTPPPFEIRYWPDQAAQSVQAN